MRSVEIRIQLLTFKGCPLAEAAREELEAALATYGPVEFEEIDILDPTTEAGLRAWGSPTILVNGADIMGHPKGNDVSCRIYPGEKGVPTRAEILALIRRRSAEADIC